MLSPNVENLYDSLTGFVDKVTHLETDSKYFLISGWAYEVKRKSSPIAMTIVNPKSQDTTGYIVFGRKKGGCKVSNRKWGVFRV